MQKQPSHNAPILAIDAGNTRIKWGLFNNTGDLLETGACLNAALEHGGFPPASSVIVSNVAGQAMAERIKNLLPDYLPIQWISAQSQACGVINGYRQPASLGTDRWAALIAASEIQKTSNQTASVVVNAGTAVTIDALITLNIEAKNGFDSSLQSHFIGGMILPGLDLMQQSLGIATAQLPQFSSNATATLATQPSCFSTNTKDGIYAGALHAILGAISLTAARLTLEYQQTPSIILSGGNAFIIQQKLSLHVTNPIIIVDNLVLKGLYYLHQFMQSDAQ